MSADRRSNWISLSAVGVELAGAMAGFALIGYLVDKHFDSAPWGIVTGVLLGLVGGLYSLVKQSLQAVRDARADDEAASKANPDERVKHGD